MRGMEDIYTALENLDTFKETNKNERIWVIVTGVFYDGFAYCQLAGELT